MKLNDLAPIVLFTYNRPKHTRKTLDALAANDLAEQSQLFIFCDGAKYDASEGDIKKIEQVRELTDVYDWPGQKKVIKRNENWGLADSIVSGVTEIIEEYGKIIVLEDDLVSGKGFLKYMNEALQQYAEESKVMHITGHVHPLPIPLPETFFYQVPGSWSWATWKNKWQYYDSNPARLLEKLYKKQVLDTFNFEGYAPFAKHLKDNINKKIHTWAVKWYASVYLNDGLCLHPGKSLIQNIGHDATGIHCGIDKMYLNQKIINYINVKKKPVKDQFFIYELMKEFYRTNGNFTWKTLLKRLFIKSTRFQTVRNNINPS